MSYTTSQPRSSQYDIEHLGFEKMIDILAPENLVTASCVVGTSKRASDAWIRTDHACHRKLRRSSLVDTPLKDLIQLSEAIL